MHQSLTIGQSVNAVRRSAAKYQPVTAYHSRGL